jgi:branched-chain amino acid transport system permease protein
MQFVNILIQGILLGGLYALYGTGLSLIFGVMRLVNVAHGDFIVLASYTSLVVGILLGVHPLLSLVIVMPCMFLLGVLLQRGIFNRMVKAGAAPPMLITVTFGLSVILQNVLQLVFTADSQGLDAGSLETASWKLNDQISIGVMPVITVLVAVSVLYLLQLFFKRSRLGQAFRAVSDDPATAELMGINSRYIYAVAMGISLAIVSLAGVLLGIRTSFSPTDGPARLIFAFETVIIGGMGSLWGTLLGGTILGVAQNIGAQLNPTWFQLAGHLVTLVILAIRPNGLFAKTRDA